MTIKNVAILTFIAVLFLLLPLSLDAKANVKDIEYLKGRDFVQLHFITDKIASIPDVIYPEKNRRLILMRFEDANFTVAKKQFKFDSLIIAGVVIKKQKKFVDVEIQLKEDVNYRVFTNLKGIYMEFPLKMKIGVDKNLQAANVSKAARTKASPKKKTPPCRAPSHLQSANSYRNPPQERKPPPNQPIKKPTQKRRSSKSIPMSLNH